MTTLQIVLRDTYTEFSRTIDYEVAPGIDTETAMFIWEDGNYACDCNRMVFLYGVDNDYPCNVGENRIVIDSVAEKA